MNKTPALQPTALLLLAVNVGGNLAAVLVDRPWLTAAAIVWNIFCWLTVVGSFAVVRKVKRQAAVLAGLAQLQAQLSRGGQPSTTESAFERLIRGEQ